MTPDSASNTRSSSAEASAATAGLLSRLREGRDATFDGATRGAVLIGAPVGILATGVQLVTTDVSPPLAASMGLTMVSLIVATGLAFVGRSREALYAMVGMMPFPLAIAQFHAAYLPDGAPVLPSMRLEALLAAQGTITILGMRGFSRVYIASTIAPLACYAYAEVAFRGVLPSDVASSVGLLGVCVVGMGLASWFAWRQEDAEQVRLEEHVRDLESAGLAARRIAAGDLSGASSARGDLAREVEELRRSLGRAIRQIRRAALEVGQAATELEATATLQSSGMAEQAAAVAETRATVSHVSEEARDIETIASTVDDRTKATLRQSGELEKGLSELIRTTERSGELLDEVRGIADKSDLLALNAALEGVRAGEAGRGFALVAAQMQQLAERVRLTVDDLQALNTQVADHSQRSRGAMVATATEAAGAMEAATDIRARAARQEQAMSQVDQSVAEISEVTHRVASGTEQLRSSSARLVELVQSIEQAVSTFALEDETQSGGWQ